MKSRFSSINFCIYYKLDLKALKLKRYKEIQTIADMKRNFEEKIQSEIRAVLNDPLATRKYILKLGDKLIKKKNENKDRDMVTLNKQCMGFFSEYEKQR